MEAIILILIPLFFKMFEECRKYRVEQAIVEGLRKPGRLERVAMWLVVRRNRKKLGIKRKEVKAVAAACLERVRCASDLQIAMFVGGDHAGLVESMVAEKVTAP